MKSKKFWIEPRNSEFCILKTGDFTVFKNADLIKKRWLLGYSEKLEKLFCDKLKNEIGEFKMDNLQAEDGKDIYEYYSLKSGDKILDIGCGKGFMLFDFLKLNSKLDVYGIDISEYAIENSIEDLRGKLKVGNALSLPYMDNYFDLVISLCLSFVEYHQKWRIYFLFLLS